MPECKFCKEPELEWFFEENTSKYKLGRKVDDNVFIPHNCKKFTKKETKKEIKPYPFRYVSAMHVWICGKHNIDLTDSRKCSKCGLDKTCRFINSKQVLLKHPYRFKIVNGKEQRDYDITLNDVVRNNLSVY